VHVDQDFLAGPVASLSFIEREAGEWVAPHAVTVEKFYRARRDLTSHCPVIPWFVQANYNNGRDIGRDLFLNASPKRVDGSEFFSKEWKVPVQIIVPMVFSEIICRTIQESADFWDAKPIPQSLGKFFWQTFAKTPKHYIQVILIKAI
jgi:hypothetical protein